MIGKRLTARIAIASALLVVAGLFSLTPAAQAGPAAAATSPACPSSGPGRIVFSPLTFTPSEGIPGQTVAAQLQATNCTAQNQTVRVSWVGRFTGAATGIPAGCPAVDGVVQNLALAPTASGTASIGFLIFVGCTATDLQVTATVGTTEANNELAQYGGDLPIRSAASACAVSYQRQSQWPGGFVAQVVIRNTSTAPVNGWALSFSYPGDQRIIQAWNATVQQSGHQVTARNVASNATIAAGASTSFGVLGSWRSADSPPSSFALNGVACAAG